MTFIDTNIILDIFDRDPAWFDWSVSHLAEASVDDVVRIDPIVIAELSRNFATFVDLKDKLDRLLLVIEPVDEASGFLAGKRFQEFRRARASSDAARVLPDFLIGAHALTLGTPLLTRDPKLYRRYFPDLALITPETYP